MTHGTNCGAEFSYLDNNPDCNTAHINDEYVFKNTKCYKNGEYFGSIISQTDDVIEVKVSNGNRYTDGTTMTFHGVHKDFKPDES
jgi:hypothetical protein